MIEQPPTRYCNTCGSLMGRKGRVDNYDAETGNPNRIYTFKCPRRKWWQLSHRGFEVVQWGKGNRFSSDSF